MALSDFMPYGAPELLEGSDRRMLRSMCVATVAVALVFPLIGMLIAKHIVEIPTIERPPVDTFGAFVPQAPPRDIARAAPAPRLVQDATPVPVPDADRTVRDVEPSAPVAETGTGAGPNTTGNAVRAGDTLLPEPPIDGWVVHDVEPALSQSVEPEYPDIAREAGVEGTVRVLMLVGLDGRVEKAIVAPGGSVLLLDEAALAAARLCVFTPALSETHPVRVWVARSYRFSLHGR